MALDFQLKKLLGKKSTGCQHWQMKPVV